MTADVSTYTELFVEEAREHLQSISKNLLILETSPAHIDALNGTFRAVHTLKSMAATMGYPDLERLAHEMENVLDNQRKRGNVEEGIIDLLLECLDNLKTCIENVAAGKTVTLDFTALYKKLEASQPARERDVDASFITTGGERNERVSPTLRISVEKIQALQNLVEELSIAKMRLLQLATKDAIPELNEITATIDRLTSELRERVMATRMFPIGFLFEHFLRPVRDLSKKTGKEVDFILAGKEVELDRLVLDEIHDALLHLLRNAVDHGIEKSEERIKAGKTDTGKIILSAQREGDSVVISVEDNGRGIDVEEIKKVAVERKIITTAVASGMRAAEVYELLGAPGLSTTKKISDISGRGIGFDVVRTKIKSLGGNISISSQKGRGTTVELRLPLTTAIIQSLLVAVEHERYAIPLTSVREIIAVDERYVKSVAGTGIFQYRGRVLPLLRLKNVLDVPGDNEGVGPVVVVERKEKIFGIMVDALIGQQETVVKPLEGMLKGKKEFAGATILGDGTVALILDTRGLLGDTKCAVPDTRV